MKDDEARLIHDMRNTVVVLRGAARQLHEQDESLPPAARAHLTSMLIRRTDMLARLLTDLATSHQVERDDLVDTLFDAYVRGAASPGLGGSGLGLLIARKLCEAMGGSLSYNHAGGARFTATFAAMPVATAPVTGRDVAPAGHSVAFCTATDVMTRDLTTYVAHGLVRGEAVVVVAATAARHDLLRRSLVELGIDAHDAIAAGQLVALDADELHRDLARLRRDRRPLRTAGQRPSRTGARGLLERPAARGRLPVALRLPALRRAGRPCAVRLSRRRRGHLSWFAAPDPSVRRPECRCSP